MRHISSSENGLVPYWRLPLEGIVQVSQKYGWEHQIEKVLRRSLTIQIDPPNLIQSLTKQRNRFGYRHVLSIYPVIHQQLDFPTIMDH